MKTFAFLLAAAALAAPAVAHPEHDEMPRTMVQKTIPEKAQDAVMLEITRAKLDASWRDATAGKPELRTVNGAPHWVVPFTSAAAKKGAARTLFVTLTQGGEFVGTSVKGR